MRIELDAEETIEVGTEAVVMSRVGDYGAVFEDDGTTGYFYAQDFTRKGRNPIVDAVHIYNVADVTDRAKPSKFQIGWSADGLMVMLTINRYPHAVFDFAAKRGYCRTGFPPPSKRWSAEGHEWDDAALRLFD